MTEASKRVQCMKEEGCCNIWRSAGVLVVVMLAGRLCYGRVLAVVVATLALRLLRGESQACSQVWADRRLAASVSSNVNCLLRLL